MAKYGSRNSENNKTEALVRGAHFSFYMDFMNKIGNLKFSRKIAMASLAIIFLAMCVWLTNRSSSNTSLNLVTQPAAAKSFQQVNNSQTAAPNPTNSVQSAVDSSSKAEGSTSSATATINGESVSVSTNDPNASTSKTINTDNGNASVSIQSSSSGSNSSVSFQSVHLNSSSSSSSNTSVDVNQQLSGGSTQ